MGPLRRGVTPIRRRVAIVLTWIPVLALVPPSLAMLWIPGRRIHGGVVDTVARSLRPAGVSLWLRGNGE